MDKGFSVLELIFSLGVMATLSAVTVGQIGFGLSHVRSTGAARMLASRLQQTRFEALKRNQQVALKLAADATLVTYADGNGDGVSARDITDGVDLPIGPPIRISDQFPGVGFGALPGLPAVDASSTAPGTDPIRLGSGNMVSFSPLGSTTSGTVYLLGPDQRQLAVRVFGETGRIRVFQFEPHTRTWFSISDR